MAVVQISRIQVRRGKANSGTGLPQLATGELAWAIDTQELYVGNGAVSEGSPAVGNTRLLTENDLSSYSNLIGLLNYTYKANDFAITTGPGTNSPVGRTFQDKLDDVATTTDFGTVANAVVDDTAALQRAINQLFLNPAELAHSISAQYPSGTPDSVRSRRVLNLPPGIYSISSTIFIPSYATIKGAGKDKTIIYYNPIGLYNGSTTNNSTTVTLFSASVSMIGASIVGTNILANTTITSVVPGQSITISNPASATGSNISFTIALTGPAIQFVNDLSTIGNPSPITQTVFTNQPRNILFSGITVHSSSGANTCMQLDSVRESVFENLLLQGDWANTYNANCIGMTLNATGALVTCEHNIFRDITFSSFSYGVFAKYDLMNNVFENCYFNEGYQGFSLGANSNGVTDGQLYGPRQTQIINCKFYNIKQEGIYLERGYSNNVVGSKFINVGNNGGGNTTALYPQIYFKTFGNNVSDTYSDRSADLLTNNLGTTPYVPEMSGHGTYKSFGSTQLTLGNPSSSMFLFRLPVRMDNSGNPAGTINYVITYLYQSSGNNFSRRGTMTISANIDARKIQLSDEYDFAGADDALETTAVILNFTTSFLDYNGNTYTGAAGQVPYSVAVSYTHNLSAESGYFDFAYTANL
jgi:hypothetical protein